MLHSPEPTFSRILCPHCQQRLILNDGLKDLWENDYNYLRCTCLLHGYYKYSAVFTPEGHLLREFLSLPEFHIHNDYADDELIISAWERVGEDIKANAIVVLPHAIKWNLNDLSKIAPTIKTYVTFS